MAESATVTAAHTLLRRARADLERGAQHVQAWLDSGGISLKPARFSDAAAVGIALVVGRELDDDATQDLADAVKKARDALDQIAWHAWINADGSESAKIYFPVRPSEDAARRVDPLMTRLADPVRELFIAAQRFDEQPPLFKQVNDFAARAKHTHPTTIATPLRDASTTMLEPPDGLALAFGFAEAVRLDIREPQILTHLFWHEADDATFSPLAVDDPRVRDLPFPEQSAQVSIGIECGGQTLTIPQLREAITRVAGLLADYERLQEGAAAPVDDAVADQQTSRI